MRRNALHKLIDWKESGTSVPFLLVGTKGTGKTYLAMEFASSYYPQYLYVNFELNPVARQYFEDRMLQGDTLTETIAAHFQLDEMYLSELLIILDEVSYCPILWTALEQEQQAPMLAISGNMPKERGEVLPFCRLFPLGFDEFLSAVGSDWYIDIIRGHFQTLKPVPDIVHQELLALFEEYLVVGGMPAAVNEYISSKSVWNVNEIHCMVNHRMKAVVASVCDEKESGKAIQVLQVLPEQLKKENKKFRFNLIRKGVTYALYKESIQVLEDSGIVLRLHEQKKEGHFKLYFPDVGMLSSAFCGLDTPETRKAILENYVMQALETGERYDLYFWESDAQAKVDFILSESGEETPVELRISSVGKGKSIASYQASTGNNNGPFYRFGFENFYSTSVVIQIPYYAIFCV